jgi:serine/threonine-protein kinase
MPPPSTPTPVVAVPPPTAVAPPPVTPRTDPNDLVRADLATFASQLPCSILDGDVRDGVIRINGIAGKVAFDALRQKLNGMGLSNPPPLIRVTQVDRAFCPWEQLLRPIARTFGEGGRHLILRLPGEPAWLRKDDFIRPRLAMAEFRGELRVDYLDGQGNVQHLYPQIADPSRHVAANPPRIFAAGETLWLGDPGPENPGWQVDEPYGTDLIIAIASGEALFDRPRPANVEKAGAYLNDLRKALEEARARGAKLTATAMALETRPK